MTDLDAESWLDREDSVCREGRRSRLDWLVTLMPESEYLTFPGGWMAKYLFEEARYSFVYGQFMAATVLGMAFAERTLASWLHASGRTDLKRANLSRLMEEAVISGWLNSEERTAIDDARRLRNPIAHFRKFGESDGVESRTVTEGKPPYELIEQDCRHVMRVMYRLLARNTV
jgi:hypothetical protein